MAFFPASEGPPLKILSTGITSFDFATGKGGIPVGRICEIFGRESVGKSALTYYMIAAAQKQGVKCAHVNVEGTFDPGFAKKITDIKLTELDMAFPDPGSEAVLDLYDAVSGGKYGLVVFDSVGSMLGDKEQDAKNSGQAGGQSLIVTRMVKMIQKPASDNECTVVFVNQIRDNFNMPGQETTPGGHAIKHTASTRIHLKPGQSYTTTIKGDLIKVGFRVNARMIKNKFGDPNARFGWDFWNQPSERGILGIDLETDLLDVAINYGILNKSGAWYTHPSFPSQKHQLQGRPAIIEAMRQDPKIIDAVRQDVIKFAVEKTHES